VSQRLNSFFSGDKALRALARKADQLATLDALFRKAAPASLLGASRVIGFERHVLKIGADSGAVAAKLRQLAPQILVRVQEDNAEVTGILVKVQVGRPMAKARRIVRPPGETGKRQIAEFASNLGNSPLKSALLRLIRHKSAD